MRHLRQNVEAILDDPGRGFFTLAGESAVATTTVRISAGGGASAEIEEIWVQPSARAGGASVHGSCEAPWRSAAGVEYRAST